jgi:xylulokinase
VGSVIGIDVGTQSVKGVLLDESGATLAVAGSACAMTHPQSGWAEQDPAAWRDAIVAVVRRLGETADLASVTHLGLACQVDGVVAVDADLDPLRPAIIWLDRRASLQAARLGERVGDERLFELTGLNTDSSHIAPKLMWLRESEPEIYARARSLPPVAGYVLGWLTGTLAQDHANASSTMLYDIREEAWSAELLDAAGIDPALLAPIRPAADPVGTLRPEVAATLGLDPACVVIVGTGDDHASALAAGLLAPGPVVDVTGTAEPVAAVASAVVLDPDRLVETHAHAVTGLLLVENPGFVSGGSVLWLAQQVLHRSQREVLELAAQAPPGADEVVFLPALSGAMAPRWNDRMRGTFLGLGMNHGDAHLARAVVEGCVFALRDIVDRLDALGLVDGEIRVVGGGARSALWLQTKADVTGRRVRAIRAEEPTALGAALLAGIAGGIFRDHAEAVERAVRFAEPIEPRPEFAAVYAERYATYRRAFDAVEGMLE